jgi:1,4-dihydroxy-2-naphthoate octaprenyltransferase
MGTLENYLLAVRPWSFSASMMPVLLGSALAYSSLHTMSFLVLFLTCISALCVHAAANLFNTYVTKKIDSSISKNKSLFCFCKVIMIIFMVLILQQLIMIIIKKK